MTVVRERKRTMVNGLVDLHNKRFAANHVELVHGQGAFTGARKLSVELTEGGARLLSADVVIESTGSRSTIPDIPGLHAAQPMTHVDALELDVVPEHLLVLGAGYVGLEFDALALESVYPDIRRATVNRFTFFLGRFGERFEDATLVHGRAALGVDPERLPRFRRSAESRRRSLCWRGNGTRGLQFRRPARCLKPLRDRSACGRFPARGM
jgi:hypothetical protein